MKSPCLRFAAFGMALLFSCQPTPVVHSTAPIENASPSHEGGATEPRRFPSIDELHAALDQIYDVRNLALAGEQPKPSGFTGILPDTAPLDTRPPGRVVGHVIGAAWAWKVTPDSTTAGCPGAIAADGRLCPEVLLPGRALEPEQVRRLLQVAAVRQEAPARTCNIDGWPVHAWVFYDTSNVPYAQLIVNLPCARWSRSAASLSPEQVSVLLELCRDAGLPGCHATSTAEERDHYSAALKSWVAQRSEPGLLPNLVRPNPLRALPTGIDEQTPITELSAANKRLLCQWNLQYSVWYAHAGRGYGVDDGEQRRSVTIQSWQECVARFPSCPATLGAVLPCMRVARLGDPWFRTQAARECQALAMCRWGYDLDAN